ncbi:MAG: T9SS type A sorting domain-containing protein [Chitinophagales bacterium]
MPIQVSRYLVGDILWTQYYGGNLSHFTLLNDVLELPDGGLAITGTIVHHNSEDIYLVRTDTNGLLTSINPLQNLQFNFNILTNPNQGVFQLSIAENTTEELTLTIFDTTGKTFSKQTIHPLSKNLDLSHLPKGIYFLQLNDGLQFGVKRLVID